MMGSVEDGRTAQAESPPILDLFAALHAARPVRSIEVRLWDGTRRTFPPGADPRIRVLVLDPSSLRAALLPPDALRLAEAFIHGTIEVLGPLDEAIEQLVSLTLSRRLPVEYLRLLPAILALPRTGPPSLGGHPSRGAADHRVGRDSTAIRNHYDLTNAFHSLWLDSRMVYSCAFFESPGDDIEHAQRVKLERLCRALQLQPGERLLDVGCGWGGLPVLAAERYGVEAVGITPSGPQVEWCRERIRRSGLGGRVAVYQSDYQGLAPDVFGTFPKIASIEMSEHVGRAHLSQYFARIWQVLEPGGLFIHQSNGISPMVWTKTLIAPAFRSMRELIDRYLLPDSDLVALDDIHLLARRAGFQVLAVDDLTAHAARTARAWLSRLEAHEDEALQEVGATMYRARRLLLAGVAAMADRRLLQVHQSVFVRPR